MARPHRQLGVVATLRRAAARSPDPTPARARGVASSWVLTLSRRIGEFIFEVVDVRGGEGILRLYGIANEDAAPLAEASADERPPARRRRVAPPTLIVQVRRSRS